MHSRDGLRFIISLVIKIIHLNETFTRGFTGALRSGDNPRALLARVLELAGGFSVIRSDWLRGL